MKKTAAKILSDRQHHLSFWLDDYNGVTFQYATLLIEAEKLINRLNSTKLKAEKIDRNRKENAAHMGVLAHESDAVYSMKAVVEGIPNMIRHIKEVERGILNHDR